MVTIPSVSINLPQSVLLLHLGARVYVVSPFPARETSGCDPIESKCQNTTDDSTEVTEDSHQDDALG